MRKNKALLLLRLFGTNKSAINRVTADKPEGSNP